jgi:hypothetical protein
MCVVCKVAESPIGFLLSGLNKTEGFELVIRLVGWSDNIIVVAVRKVSNLPNS